MYLVPFVKTLCSSWPEKKTGPRRAQRKNTTQRTQRVVKRGYCRKCINL